MTHSYGTFLCVLAVILATGCTKEPASSSAVVTSPTDAGSLDDVPVVDIQVNVPDEITVESTPTEPAVVTDDGSLTIGSKAPALDIEHWVSDGLGKFQPVTSFAAGKVYIVEFWATWCGPCVSSMPHLVETQEKYAEEIQIISTSTEDIGTVNDFLEKPYRGGAEGGPATYGELTSAYCLTTDPDGSVNTDYMKAAGRNGIPCAFIVGKTGLVEWIGHPMAMDSALEQIVHDQWDRVAFATEFSTGQAFDLTMRKVQMKARGGDIDGAKQLIADAKATATPNQMAQLARMESQLLMAPIGTLMQNGDMTGALAKLEEILPSVEGPMKEQLEFIRLNLLMESKDFEAAAAALASQAETMLPETLNQIAWSVYEAGKDGEIPDAMVGAAVDAAKKATEEIPDNGMIMDTLSHLLHLQGNVAEALEVQTKALENPGQAETEIKAFLEQLKQELKEKE